MKEAEVLVRPAPARGRAGEGTPIPVFGAQMRVLIPSGAARRAYAVWEHLCPPGYGPPRHIHHREDEIVQVMEGKIVVWCDGESWEAEPGHITACPRGVPHTFRVTSSAPARLIVTAVPGGFERFFAAVSGLDREADRSRLSVIYESYGVENIGPPLEA